VKEVLGDMVSKMAYVGERKKKGEIHLSSPLWVDISIWGGSALLAVSSSMLIIGVETFSDGEWELVLDYAIIVGSMLFATFKVSRLRKDLNDKMIIADDYLSIDKPLSKNKKVIKKNNILKIELRTFDTSDSDTDYIIITYTELKDEVEVESEYAFSPAKRLNISRDVIVKHLKLKGYGIKKGEEFWE
jgi:hypothetical protein